MSNEDIKRIEDELLKLSEDGNLSIENSFNLGVRLGRILECKNIDDLKLDYFYKQDKLYKLRLRIEKLNSKVLANLEMLLHLSIKEHINISKYKCWSTGFEKRFTDDAVFSDAIVKKRNVQFHSLRAGETQYHFIANFKITGNIAELFEKYNQSTNFEIVVDDDSGEGNVDIKSPKDLAKLYGLSAYSNFEMTDSGVDTYENFVNAFDKKLLFTKIENPEN